MGLHKRQKRANNPPSDIISDLPGNVIDSILMCMPLRDAVRTSILSRQWRYHWTKIPELKFDDTLCPISAGNRLSCDKLMIIIYQVLLVHSGPIRRFCLSASALESCSAIDHLMLYLSKQGIEGLVLHFPKRHHSFPSLLSSWPNLRHLNLRGCSFTSSTLLNGFRWLRCVELYYYNVDPAVLGNSISRCPLLERLTLESESSSSFDYLEIDAPMLKYLYLDACISSICFKNTPLLASLSIRCFDYCGRHKEYETPKMIEVLGSLPVIEDLHITYEFTKFLTFGGVPDKLPRSLNSLKVVDFDEISFTNIDDVAFVLCLIKSSPNLEKVMIEMFSDTDIVLGPVLELLELRHFSDISFNRLRLLEIRRFHGIRTELKFIKLILAISPVLEKMHICYELEEDVASNKEVRMLKELSRFKRVSPNVEIDYGDSNDDQV